MSLVSSVVANAIDYLLGSVSHYPGSLDLNGYRKAISSCEGDGRTLARVRAKGYNRHQNRHIASSWLEIHASLNDAAHNKGTNSPMIHP